MHLNIGFLLVLAVYNLMENGGYRNWVGINFQNWDVEISNSIPFKVRLNPAQHTSRQGKDGF